MFLLILICYLTAMCIQLSLHSNMFLLILKAQMMWCEIEHLFTFQYVSINTQPTRQNRLANYTLHSNMFLLIQNGCRPFQIVEKSLHSNMFLLIRKSRWGLWLPGSPLHSNMFLLIQGYSRSFVRLCICFTFQYVSINTEDASTLSSNIATLHSNMFLLIRFHSAGVRCTKYPLHSNMFLLIRYETSIVTGEMRSFTFQYVSINTAACYWRAS